MTSKKTLVIGASPNSSRYAYKAVMLLNSYGYEVVAYGRRAGVIGSTQIVTEWPVNEKINTVTLYVGPQHQHEFIEKVINLNPERVIFNPGTENAEFSRLLVQHKIKPIEACTLVMLNTHQY